jgi:ParB/RepB/Spo0J family partition protein
MAKPQKKNIAKQAAKPKGANKPTAAKAAKEPKAGKGAAAAVPLGSICADPRNPRRRAITPENDPGLQELADSISRLGDVIEPLILRLRTDKELKGKNAHCPECAYMLISGHRRLAAARLAGLAKLSCIAWHDISPEAAFEMQLMENLHRADLLPTEEADAYQRMSEELGYTQEEIALRTGRSERHVRRYLKLQKLPAELKDKIDSGEFTIQKALFFCSLPEKAAKDCLKNNPYFFGHSYSLSDFQSMVQREYIEDLEAGNLPFDPAAKYGTLPKCAGCPHRESTPELFEEYAKAGNCPFAPCFRQKAEMARAAARAQKQANKKHKAEDGEENAKKSQKEQINWQLEQKIRNAVIAAKHGYYLEKLNEKGITPALAFNEQIGDADFLDADYAELYLSNVGKDLEELKRSGTWEEILKAKIISEFLNKINYDEDEVAEFLGCAECPDELLREARATAMGVNKKA